MDLVSYLWILLSSIIHFVPEGHLAVYYRGGALLNVTASPGLNYKLPYLTTVHMIQVSLQTDVVRNVPCGTKSGVEVVFERIEVVNYLDPDHVLSAIRQFGPEYDQMWIHQRIAHTMNQICSSTMLHEIYVDRFDQLDEELTQALQSSFEKYDVGIKIQALRVTKPSLGKAIAEAYSEIEQARTTFRVSESRQHLELSREATARSEAVTSAKSAKEVAVIAAQKEAERRVQAEQIEADRRANIAQRLLIDRQALRNASLIEETILLEKARATADAQLQRMQMEALSNAQLLTPEYLKVKAAECIGRVEKTVYSDVPDPIQHFFPM